MTAPPGQLLDLSGRVVLVTGAGGGIGRGIASRMAAAGAAVAAHTRASPLDGLLDGLPAEARERALPVAADLTEADGPARVVDAVVEAFGRIDGLVNNAGIQPIAHFADLTDAEWSEMLEVNLTAVHRLTQTAAAAMKRAGNGGSIVHIASIEGHHAPVMHGHYGVSKAGLIMHARSAAIAYGPDGIRVNAVSPGLIRRPGLEEDWPDGVARWGAACPLGRMGSPEEVGDACLFLMSDLARWITGAELVVDGGVSATPTW